MVTHTISLKKYLIIFLALIFFTFLTALSSTFHLGNWEVVIALIISFIKATLIVLFFMHVRFGEYLIGMAVAAGLMWLILLFGLTMSDYLTRTWSYS